MITVGPMQLHQPQGPDPMEAFFLGTQTDGGYWTDASRISSHDHSGGLMGAAVAVSIPDGSITAADLDPSVLAPYALTDGSKPFTGQVTMQADAVVRDAVLFGQQGTALAPDVTLTRTAPDTLQFGADVVLKRTGAGALRVDTHLGVGATPAAWGATARAAQVGAGGALIGDTAALSLTLTGNAYVDAGGWKALGAGPASQVALNAGQVVLYTAATAAAGGALTPVERLRVATDGSVQLAPNTGAPALTWAGGAAAGGVLVASAGGEPRVAGTGAKSLVLGTGSGYIYGDADNAVNFGHPSIRWAVGYFAGGVVTTSSQEFKEGITPLDPGRAMDAVRNTQSVTFDYVAPTRTAEWYDLPDDPEQAEAVLQQRLTAAPLEAAARHQHGFIAEDCDPLFLVGEGQTSPGSSIGVLLAALQNIDQRLAALETP
jgi:hypothetical protein